MKKIKNIAIITFFVIACAIGILLYWVPQTPEYSLYQIATAFTEHDYDKFQEYVDTQSIVNEIVNNKLADAKKDGAEGNLLAQLRNSITYGFMAMLKPQMVKVFQSAMKQAVEDGYKGDKFDTSKISLGLINFVVFRKIGDYNLKSTIFNGKKCKLTVIYKDETIFIGLKNKNNKWIVTSLDISAR